MKLIINLLKNLLFIGYSLVLSYIVWLLFYWITPLIIGLSWFWFIIGTLVVFSVVFTVITGLIIALSIPVIFLKTNKSSFILPVMIALFFAYSSFMLPWHYIENYTLLKILLAITIDIQVLTLFYGIIISMVSTKEKLNE